MAGGEEKNDDHDLLIALRHPLRRQILRKMAEQDPISPRQISDELREPLSNVSYHVRVLADCGAVTLVDTAPVRGSMQHFYSPAINEPWALAVLGLSGNGNGSTGAKTRTPRLKVRMTMASNGENLTNEGEDVRVEAALMQRVLDLHPARMTLDELVLDLNGEDDDFAARDALERAIAGLTRAGLLHRTEDCFVTPTRAAVHFGELRGA